MAQVESLAKIWPSFGDTSLLEEKITEEGGNLASDVLAYFGIPCAGAGGGSVPGVDIKRMDALSVIQLSLLDEAGRTGKYKEAIVNEFGQVEFVEIGTATSTLDSTYFQSNTATYKEACTGVMITGRKELPKVKDLKFSPIWGENKEAKIFSNYGMLDNCNKDDFQKTARIVFNDPHLSSDYNDGLVNRYEINDTNVDDKIIGYVYACNMTDINKLATVDLSGDTSIMVQVSTGTKETGGAQLGTLVKVPKKKDDTASANCWAGAEVGAKPTGGVPITLPAIFTYETIRGTKVNKFIKVSAVMVVGQVIDQLHSSPVSAADQVSSEGKYTLYCRINDSSSKTHKLREKMHYSIYINDDDVPHILFGADVDVNDPLTYGTGVKYKLMEGADQGEKTGTILPLNSGKSGILVDEVWALVDIQTPSIIIQDPTGNAKKIAEDLVFNVAPLVITDPPAPVIFCDSGGATTLKQLKQDHDPVTTQNFADSEIETALDKMQGGGMTLSMASLSEDQCKVLAKTLYDHMNSGASVTETIYTCGPKCKPKLGGKGANGIVNAIRYSYTDQGSYTVSVTEGGYLVGNLGAIDGGITYKLSDSPQARGVIRSDLGNGIHFKVSLDGIGDRIAVNMSPSIIRVGDVVSCTIHNCPVEA